MSINILTKKIHILINKATWSILTILIFIGINPILAQNSLNIHETPIYIGNSVNLWVDGDITLEGHETIANEGTITILGDYTINRAPFTSNHETVFASDVLQSISGDSTIWFERIVVQKPDNKLVFEADVLVSQKLQLNNGIVDIQDYDLDLGVSGSFTDEHALSYVTGGSGEIISMRILDKPSAMVNPGNLGVIITCANNLGNTLVKRGHTSYPSDIFTGINRYYLIEPEYNENLLTILTTKYTNFDNELNNIDETELVPYISYDMGASWLAATAEIDTTANEVSITNLSSFALITLGKTNPSTSIPQINEEELLFYPNPANEGATLNINGFDEKTSLSIFNLVGQVVYQNDFESGRAIQIQATALIQGNYLIKLTTASGNSLIGKLIIK